MLAQARARDGLYTVGALAAMEETAFCRILGGKAGRTLRNRARGIDPRGPVLVRAGLLDLIVTLAERIRRREQVARKVTVSVRLTDGSTVDRTRVLPQASAHTEDLRAVVFRIGFVRGRGPGDVAVGAPNVAVDMAASGPAEGGDDRVGGGKPLARWAR
ncbi:hypothetical protein [Streptomyces sp. DH12]|uniref:DinB/UmuC family translesion DNA polymerase n=1 Tax=Streptomyces sp. DH12 TaxID=2857010 RepID=UPI001E5A87BB|nr:hypothetical protein [Streptomyces sp. DH12]